MIGNKECFSSLEEKDFHMNIELGDDGRYNAIGIGTIKFKRDYGSDICIKDVMLVPGMKNNLISVLVLEDRGYVIIFSKGKAFLKHVAIGKRNRLELE